MDWEDLSFAARYPFSEKAKLIVSELGISFSNLDPVYIERAIERIKQAIKGKTEINYQTKLSRVLEAEIVSYPVAKVLVALSRDPFIKKGFAKGEASALRSILMRETRDISEVAEELGISLDNGKIHFKDYLRYIPSDDNYKLVYQEMRDGFVKVNDDLLVEILASAYERKLEKDLSRYPKDLEFMKKYLSELKIEKKAKFEYKGPMDAEAFPPCMKKILADAAAGIHLGHNARFAIATFLVNIGLDEDSIVNVFRKQDNFNERLTRYHIEYIMGKKSGEKRMVPSCEKMKIYGLCVNPDDLCKRIKNPLSYYRIAARRRSRGTKKVAPNEVQ